MSRNNSPRRPPIIGNVLVDGNDHGLVVTRMSDVAQRRPKFLWPGRIPQGALTLLIGDPDLGKSMISIDLIARLTAGLGWPDGRSNRSASAVVLAAEDDAESTLLPRLHAAGADATRVHCVEGVRQAGSLGSAPFSLRDDLHRLDALMEEVGDVRLIVIDPVNQYLAGADTGRDAEVRAILGPLLQLAARHRAAVVGIMHMNKQSRSKAMYRSLGSIAFAGLARAAWLVARDPREGAEANARVIVPIKFNLGHRPHGIAFHVEGSRQGRGRVPLPVVRYDGFDLTLTAEEVLAASPRPQVRESAEAAAKRWAEEQFAKRPTIPTVELRPMARAAGIAWRTFERVAAGAGLRSFRGATGWLWTSEPITPLKPTDRKKEALRPAVRTEPRPAGIALLLRRRAAAQRSRGPKPRANR